MELKHYKPIIFCSGISKEQLSFSPEFLEFWTLRFTQTNEIINKADIVLSFKQDSILAAGLLTEFPLELNLVDIVHKISPLNLSYIEQLFETEAEQKEMIQLVRKELTLNIEELIMAMKKNDSQQIKQSAHKLSSKLLVLSIPVADELRFLEMNPRNVQSEVVQEKYFLLKMHCLIRLWQIQDIE